MAACDARFNPKLQTDLFEVVAFDHLEFTVGDALSSMKIMKRGLGMELIGESKKETGNHSYSSYVLKSNNVKYIVSAPYLTNFKHPRDKKPNPAYDPEKAAHFFQRHGSGVSAVGIEVKNCREAYQIATSKGATGVVPPVELVAEEGGKIILAEIELYSESNHPDPLRKSDTVLRFLEYQNYTGPFLPGYKAVKDPHPLNYGILRMDHVVGNVYDMDKIISDIKNWTGFHTFAKFSKEENSNSLY